MFEDLILPLIESAAGAGVAGAVVWSLYTRWHVPVPPNRALVLYGRHTGSARGDSLVARSSVEVRRPRVVVGGSAFVAPWNRGVGFLSLGPIDADITVRSLHAVSGGRATGWEAQIHVQARIPAEPTTLLSAAENLLGKNDEEVRLVIRHAVEGAVPAVLARLRPSAGEPDWERLAVEIESSVAPDLVATGLVIRTLSVTGLQGISPAEAPAAVATGTAVEPRRPVTVPIPPSLNSDVELRMARVERGLGIMGAEILRIARESRDPADLYRSASVFDSALGDERSLAGLLPVLEGESTHDSMGGDRSPQTRRPPEGDTVGEGGRDPRPLLDSEPLR